MDIVLNLWLLFWISLFAIVPTVLLILMLSGSIRFTRFVMPKRRRR